MQANIFSFPLGFHEKILTKHLFSYSVYSESLFIFSYSPLKVTQLFLIFLFQTCYTAYIFFYISLFVHGHIILWESNVSPGCRVYTFNILTLPSCPPKRLYQFKFLPTVFYCFNLHFPVGAVEHLFMCLFLFISFLYEFFIDFSNFSLGCLLFDHRMIGTLYICCEKENCSPQNTGDR